MWNFDQALANLPKHPANTRWGARYALADAFESGYANRGLTTWYLEEDGRLHSLFSFESESARVLRAWERVHTTDVAFAHAHLDWSAASIVSAQYDAAGPLTAVCFDPATGECRFMPRGLLATWVRYLARTDLARAQRSLYYDRAAHALAQVDKMLRVDGG